jgi:hypothetical protein
MSDLLGLLVLLGAMMTILRLAIRGTADRRRDGKRRYERPPRHWWLAAIWIPTGFAVTKLLGTGAPVSVAVILAVLIAAVHRAAPGPIDLAAGALGTVISVTHVIEGNDCRGPLGMTGILLLLVFCGTTAVCTVVTGLSRHRLTVGQGLVAICAAIELALFAVSPGGILPTGAGDLGTNVIVTLATAILVGIRPQFGLATVGACLIAAETSLALSGTSCDRSAPIALAGALAFATTRLILSSRRNRQLIGVR